MDTAPRQTDKLFDCQKTGKKVPLRQPRCAHPDGYCKWRTACPIRLLEKEDSRS